MQFFIQLLCIFISLVYADTTLNRRGGGVFGSNVVIPNFRYSWIVSLQYKGHHRCGGILYNTNTILTAASCVIGSFSDWEAAVKRHDISLTSETGGGYTYKIVKRTTHSKHNSETGAYNISLWKISTWFWESQPTIPLDDGKFAKSDGTLLKVVGWGLDKSNEIYSNVLLVNKVPVFNSDSCKNVHKPFDTFSQFCAGFPDDKESCYGDMGSPIFTDENGTATLVGISTVGRNCQFKDKPAIYTKVAPFVDWIKQGAN